MESEIQGKLIQALLVWREQGGPKYISVTDATNVMNNAGKNISESKMRSIVGSHPALKLNGDIIELDSQILDAL